MVMKFVTTEKMKSFKLTIIHFNFLQSYHKWKFSPRYIVNDIVGDSDCEYLSNIHYISKATDL